MKMRSSTVIDGTTAQQKLFAYAYFNNKGNGTQAAIDAGYSKRSAKEQASRLLTKANVQKILTRLNKAMEIEAIITKEEVLLEYKKIALFDLRTLYDDNNTLKPISDFSDAAGAAITGIDIDELFDVVDGKKVKTGVTVKVRLNGKIAALDSIRDTMGWKAPTKVAAVNKDGEDVLTPFNDKQVDELLKAIRENKNS